MNPDNQDKETQNEVSENTAPLEQAQPSEVEQDVVEQSAQPTDEDIAPREKFYKLSRGETAAGSLSDEDKVEIIMELRENAWYVNPMQLLFPDDPKGDEQAKIEKLIELKELEELKEAATAQ